MSHSAPSPGSGPSWDALFATAQAQLGYFTTKQAAAAGYSPQLLYKYLDSGKITRERRGIYRLVHFPPGEHEDLVMLWLWSERRGVFSHQTALALHDLSDVLPHQAHMTVPAGWRDRRLRVPDGLVLHHADLAAVDCTSFDAVPVTAPRRTLRDCIEANVSPDLVRQAVHESNRRGLVPRDEAARLEAALDRHAEAVG